MHPIPCMMLLIKHGDVAKTTVTFRDQRAFWDCSLSECIPDRELSLHANNADNYLFQQCTGSTDL